jgi:hypothetical protein
MSAEGRWGASAVRWSSRQAATFTGSMSSARVGHAPTHAGASASSRRGLHMSHLVTIRRSGWKTGTEYGQFQVQYSQPMHSSALWATTPLSSLT